MYRILWNFHDMSTRNTLGYTVSSLVRLVSLSSNYAWWRSALLKCFLLIIKLMQLIGEAIREVYVPQVLSYVLCEFQHLGPCMGDVVAISNSRNSKLLLQKMVASILSINCSHMKWHKSWTPTNKSVLVWLMAWWHQGTNHYMNQCWQRCLTHQQAKMS